MAHYIPFMTSFIDPPQTFKNDIRLTELNIRLHWFLMLRFIVIAVLIIFVPVKYFMLPDVAASSMDVIAVAAILLFLNIIYLFHYKKIMGMNNRARQLHSSIRTIQLQMIMDFLALGYIVYIFGGIESPLIFIFLIHIILACLFFKRSVSLVYMLLSNIIVTVIVVGSYFHLIPSTHFMTGMASIEIVHSDAVFYYSYYFGAIMLNCAIWYVVSSITNSMKKHESMLQEKIEEMTRYDEERTRYMLTTTHELKAPFAAIQSYTNMVLCGYAGEISSSMRGIMVKIRDRCDRLMKMITDMLKLANLQSLKDKPLVMAEVDMYELIFEIIQHFDEKTHEKGLTIITSMPEGERPLVTANQEQMEMLMTNIISNAVAYSYPNTSIEIELKNEKDRVFIAVKDHGIGIKKDQLSKVFIEYYRTEDAVEMNKSSTGLGLSTAKQIVELHFGKIWIESEEKKDTQIYIEIPSHYTRS